MTQNVEAWIGTSTGEEPRSARDVVLERLRGRNPQLAYRERVKALIAQVTAMRDGIPQRVENLVAQGVDWDTARKRVNDEIDQFEEQAMKNLEKDKPKGYQDTKD